MDSTDKYVGRILDNRYEIIERIGTGGMALVYKARCHRLNRLVAIKILKEDLAGDEEFRRRFHTESQAVAMLSHPNIVAVYDVSRSDNTEYIVMELIEGITLKQYINRKGLLNWKESLHFVMQITKALSHAHSRGIIHRDIKPHNIMILKDGSVKVADFGIARLLSMQNTLTQEALGSVHYISPEQAKGGHVDARSDIYSVGVVMYEMLTSRLPFVGDSAVSVAIQHISAIPLMPRDINPDVPEGLENITMHAMEPDINLRYTTADEMLGDLEDFRKNPAITFSYTKPEIFEPNDIFDVKPVSKDDLLATKTVPSGAIIKAERTIPKPKRIVKKPEMTKDEYRGMSKKATRTSTMFGVLSIIVFLLVVIVYMWNYLLRDIFNPPEREMISIPSFVGMYYDEVSTDKEYTQLYDFIIIRTEPNDRYEPGQIVSQSPKADRQMSAPTASRKIDIEVVLSEGKTEPVYMPELVGRHYQDARNTLNNLVMDLIIDIEPVASDSITKDYVIETIPEEGAVLERGNSIVIRYSSGPDIKKERVPDLTGRTKAELQSAFDHLLLVPDYYYFEDDSEIDTVLFIARMNEEVEIHTKIVVHISKGPPQTQTNETPNYEEPTAPVETTVTHDDPTHQPEETPGVVDNEEPSEGEPPTE